MSGGSWSYLYSRGADELIQSGNIELLEEIAEQLKGAKQNEDFK